jgi:hypothetical protein
MSTQDPEKFESFKLLCDLHFHIYVFKRYIITVLIIKMTLHLIGYVDTINVISQQFLISMCN